MTDWKNLSRLNAPLLVVAALLLGGCAGEAPDEWTVPGRWYTQAQVDQGREVFLTHCASCHGTQAEGTEEWWVPDDDGFYPPPPLNGTAHDWHHPLEELLDYIEHGGLRFGGQMPPFGDIVDQEERHAAVAFFQSFWPEEIYRRWVTIHQRD